MLAQLFRKISRGVTAIVAMAVLAVGVLSVSSLLPATAAAYDPLGEACSAGASSQVCGDSGGGSGGASSVDPVSSTLNRVTGIMSLILGVIAVIFVIVGGLKYVTANGDAAAVASAKNTIVYALIGLVIAALARPIINFVIGLAVR